MREQDHAILSAEYFSSKTVNYTVDDYVLRKKVGMHLNIPASNPSYFGGAEALKNYFAATSLTKREMFRIFIGFVVNCKGKVGNFQIVSEGRSDMHNEVFEIAKKMQRWKPALSKQGKPVDSYQILTLTIYKENIIDAYYK